jgi:hypothetical protein
MKYFSGKPTKTEWKKVVFGILCAFYQLSANYDDVSSFENINNNTVQEQNDFEVGAHQRSNNFFPEDREEVNESLFFTS